MFEQDIGELYEKRWSAVQEFLSQAWPLLLVLRRVWNRTSLPPTSRAFAADGEGRAFSVAAFEATLDNNLFFILLHDGQDIAQRRTRFGRLGRRVPLP